MELHAEVVIAFDNRGKLSAVVGDGHCLSGDWRTVRVRVIDECSRFNSTQQPRFSYRFDLVPTNMWGLDSCGKTLADRVQRSQAAHFRRLFTALEHPLHANADTK